MNQPRPTTTTTGQPPLTFRMSFNELVFAHAATQSRQRPPRPTRALLCMRSPTHPPHGASASINVSELDACHFFPPPVPCCGRTPKKHNKPKNVGLKRREKPAAARYTPPPDALQMLFMSDACVTLSGCDFLSLSLRRSRASQARQIHSGEKNRGNWAASDVGLQTKLHLIYICACLHSYTCCIYIS